MSDKKVLKLRNLLRTKQTRLSELENKLSKEQINMDHVELSMIIKSIKRHRRAIAYIKMMIYGFIKQDKSET